ncbi:hypothetical protein SLOPH_2351 [Spraguea lophii 42_110]|uniref:DUF8032 domain-containing protein n=1 Tax=Spraguea lophii (strain 42_110) TaxID=1358809 RepID=S7WA65_SPRLO|nr:hypothetical protein SLOPH_2351 [Spraguea lophii 42_110]
MQGLMFLRNNTENSFKLDDGSDGLAEEMNEIANNEYFSIDDRANEQNIALLQKGVEDDMFNVTPVIKKKDKKKKKKVSSSNKIPSIKKVVNLPATPASIRIFDGEERLCFKYNTKVSEAALNTMPRGDLEENEFCVRFDVESVNVNSLTEKFRMDNCIYPRVCCPHEQYKGNRWAYETEVNKLAWQFVALNTTLLYGKKGLLQRCVDSYRNINNQSRSRRVVKHDKDINPISRRRQSEYTPYTSTISWMHKGNIKKCKIRIDVENAKYEDIDEDFKFKFSIFPDTYDEESFGLTKWETNNPDNILAIKIAQLNIDNTSFWNAIKATDKESIIRKSVEAYKNRGMDVETDEEMGDEGLSNILVTTMEQIDKEEKHDDNAIF